MTSKNEQNSLNFRQASFRPATQLRGAPILDDRAPMYFEHRLAA